MNKNNHAYKYWLVTTDAEELTELGPQKIK